jgi:hypothetical protein
VLVRLEGYHEFAPQRLQANSPWLDALKGGQLLRAGGRVGGTVATADVGHLTTLHLRGPKKLLRAVSLVEVVRSDSGEVVFFALGASKRAASLLANDGEVTLTREPLHSPLYRSTTATLLPHPTTTVSHLRAENVELLYLVVWCRLSGVRCAEVRCAAVGVGWCFTRA